MDLVGQVLASARQMGDNQSAARNRVRADCDHIFQAHHSHAVQTDHPAKPQQAKRRIVHVSYGEPLRFTTR
jgi:hypothetical protein